MFIVELCLRLDLRRAHHTLFLLIVVCLRLDLRRAHYTLFLLIVVSVLVVADVNDFGTPVCFGGAHYTLVRYLSLPT